MNSNFDPRAWNLFAGVALVSAGCGPGQASQEAGDTGETADTNPEGPEEGPECVDSGDCPVGYGCYDGVCMYYPHHDGWIPYYDCYSDEECGEFQQCQYGYCETFDLPSPICGDLGLAWPPPTSIDASQSALALSFADVDADGQDELVVATTTDMRVYESGGGDPITSAREGTPIADMVAGDFDGIPGEDVLLLVGETLVLHASNGDGSFAPGITNPLQLGFVNELFAGQFDALPPSDLIGWGGAGAFIDVSGDFEIFTTAQIADVAVHEQGASEPGFALRRDTDIEFYSFDALLISTWDDVGSSLEIAAWRRGVESHYVTLMPHSSWSTVQSRDPYQSDDEWVIYGTPGRIFAGDLDGSETDELVFFDGTLAFVQYNPQEDGDCIHELPVSGPLDAVFGDHDGDGDRELAIVTHQGEVALFDGG